MLKNIWQTISGFTGTALRKEDVQITLSEEHVSVLTENVSTFLTQHKRGAYLLTNLADNNQLVANNIIESVKARNKELLIVPVQIKLGGLNNRLSVALIEEMKKCLRENKELANNLDDSFWRRLENSLNEAKQTHRKVSEQTLENLKQWISSTSIATEQGIDVKANLGVSPVFSVTPGFSITNREGAETKVVESANKKTRQSFETEINNWDEIKSLNDLHQLIDDVGKNTLLFYYDLIESGRQILQDPEIRKLQRWFDELSRSLGCLGCIFAPVIIVFNLGLKFANFLLWMIRPFYYLLRIVAKRMPIFGINIMGKRKPKLLFVIDGVEGANYMNDVSIFTLQSLFRNLNAMFVVFTDEKTYGKYFSL